jgi:arylsulfatase B
MAGASIEIGKPSPRKEVVYNIEPFRGGVREGDWKLIWRTLLPSALELYNIAEDPSEKTNLADKNPEIVAKLQKRIEELARESAKSLFLVDAFTAVKASAHGAPALPKCILHTRRLAGCPHIASFRCDAEFGPLSGNSGSGGPSAR